MKKMRLVSFSVLILVMCASIVTAFPMTIMKTHDLNPVKPGDTFTYTIAITNPNAFDVFEPRVTDSLPSEVDVVSCNAGCNTEALPFVDWEGIGQPEIAAGETIYRTVTVTMKSDTAGKEVCNSATVRGGTGPNPTYGMQEPASSQDCMTIPSGSNDFSLNVKKTHDLNPVKPGDTFNYIIEVSNPNPFNVDAFYVTDTLPPEVEYIDAFSHDYCGGPANEVCWDGMTNWRIVPGSSKTYTITVKVKTDAGGKEVCNKVLVDGGYKDVSLSGPGLMLPATAEDCIMIQETVPIPEFTSVFLPVIMVIGILGAVLLIRRSGDR
jgi:uncharacterized repeat protein (TIGR01451 family)